MAMEHNGSERHVYYGTKTECLRLVKWLVECDYWFEGITQNGGRYAITCGVEPDRIELVPGVDLASEAA